MRKYLNSKERYEIQKEKTRLRDRRRYKLERAKVLRKLQPQMQELNRSLQVAQDFVDSIKFPEDQLIRHDLYGKIDDAIARDKMKTAIYELYDFRFADLQKSKNNDETK